MLADEFNRMAGRLQESHATLERKVVERTAELARKKQEADSASAAKTRFLASASHDLRQPMHAISLLVGLLKERSRDDSQRELVDKVQASVDAMENLFSGLLDISKLDAGAVKPRIAPFEIGGLLRQIELHFAPQAREKGVELRVHHCSAVVLSDPVILERIVINLVTNAIRYTERGKVVVGCRRLGDRLRLLVLDTGVGIAPEHLADVFEEFVQLPHTERDRSKGLGLGLAIVKRSADLLGHTLIVRSQPGRGSTFGIELPRETLPVGMDQPCMASSAANLEGTFVAIIDDDRESRHAMELTFRQWGCHVVSADTDEAAMIALGDHLRSPDLIVTDFRLRGGHSGLAAISRIREHSEQDVPAIVVTGDVMVADPAGNSLEGIVLMHKPVNFERLRAAAAELVRMGKAAE
jgi:CheY-like chemotaxis protein/nitrogen-specific signal transduction histidine kinase